MIKSVNPETGRTISTYEEASDEELFLIVHRAHEAFGKWRRRPVSERVPLLSRVADLLETEQDRWAALMAEEMGKPIGQGRSEVRKCGWVCRYYQEQGESFLAPEDVDTETGRSFVVFEPLGIVLSIMPWNFPFWQVFRSAVPSLAAGNVVLLKHSGTVPGCALAIQELFRRAGFPEGVFSSLLMESARVHVVLSHPLVRAVTLTGSVKAGVHVAGRAGAEVKKCVMELGGSDPYLVLEDADLEQTVEVCAESRLINSGQSCIAAKRFIVVEPLYEPFIELMIEKMREKKVGSPLDEDTDVGPLARLDLRDELHEQVSKSIEHGARCLLGGKVPDGKGFYYPPTVLADVATGMPAFEEELFGPVASVILARNEREAVELANNSSFGLGAGVFTRDRERGKRIATKELEAGSCFVNSAVRSDPRLPFGGVKQSGFGRELSRYGIREFVNVKSIHVE
jgi:succinate-semialdehyde dehydrogenase/glutarate-semialdehyde dehydrogenase